MRYRGMWRDYAARSLTRKIPNEPFSVLDQVSKSSPYRLKPERVCVGNVRCAGNTKDLRLDRLALDGTKHYPDAVEIRLVHPSVLMRVQVPVNKILLN